VWINGKSSGRQNVVENEPLRVVLVDSLFLVAKTNGGAVTVHQWDVRSESKKDNRCHCACYCHAVSFDPTTFFTRRASEVLTSSPARPPARVQRLIANLTRWMINSLECADSETTTADGQCVAAGTRSPGDVLDHRQRDTGRVADRVTSCRTMSKSFSRPLPVKTRELISSRIAVASPDSVVDDAVHNENRQRLSSSCAIFLC